MISKFSRHASVLLALGIIFAAAAATPVSADTWGSQSTTTGAHPDSNPHTYCYETGFPETAAASDMENNALGDPTDANVNWQEFCDYSSQSETDVVWQWRNLDGSQRGYTFCEDYDTYCDQYYVQIDVNYIIQNSDPDAENIRKTMCHELGHSVGLSHGSTYGGCMVSGPVNGDVQWRRYSSHHKDHINAWFS